MNLRLWVRAWIQRFINVVFFQQQTVRLSPRRCLPFVTVSSNEDKTQVFLYFNTGGKWVMEMFIIFEELQHRETRTNRPQYFAHFLSSFWKFSSWSFPTIYEINNFKNLPWRCNKMCFYLFLVVWVHLLYWRFFPVTTNAIEQDFIFHCWICVLQQYVI